VFRAVPVDTAGKFLHERVPFALPVENGYSMVGEVLELGKAATGFHVGDRVFVPAPHKQIVAVPAHLAVKLPESIQDEQAVFLNILEVGHIALRRVGPGIGENVAIVGQGVIGLGTLAYCRAFGLRTAVLDTSPARLDIARRIGANLAVAPDDTGLRQVLECFDGAGADLVLEAASHWSAIVTAMQVARENGKVVVVSRHTGVPNFNPVGHPYLGKKLTLLTSYGHEPPGHRWDRPHSIALTLRLLSEGKLQIEPIITHRVSWTDLPDVYQRLHAGDREMAGVVVKW
jgi:threonine dehydrogenase-like Zn-dependent dehydrogenase